MAAHVRLKNEFTEAAENHNLMALLVSVSEASPGPAAYTNAKSSTSAKDKTAYMIKLYRFI